MYLIYFDQADRNLKDSTSRAYNAMVYNSIYDGSEPVYETVHQNLVLERTLKPKFDSVRLKNHTTRYIDQPVHSTQLQSKLATTCQCSLRHSATGDQETNYVCTDQCVCARLRSYRIFGLGWDTWAE